jgi:hypothetical protein
MKKIILSVALLCISNVFSQAYDGYADNKTSIGGTFQKGAVGLVFSFDRGINDYLSYGSSFGFTVSSTAPPEFTTTTNDVFNEFKPIQYERGELLAERIDLNLRLNGHFGKLMGLGEMADVFAGINVGLRAVGTQIGARYLISDSFGFFAEGSLPISKYRGVALRGESNTNSDNLLPYYEQPVFSVGIIFSN